MLTQFPSLIFRKKKTTKFEFNFIVFDPNECSDENNEEYKKIYDEYKHLVDFMLGSFMEEMQITPEQFEVACLAGKHSASGLSFHQGLFQQVFNLIPT